MITQLPIIHLNGTSANALFEDHATALASIRQARQDISGIEFHSRDYYPLGNQAWSIAREERNEMLRKLDEVEKDLVTLAIHINQFIKH